MHKRWKPNVTVATVLEQGGRCLLLEDHTDDGVLLQRAAVARALRFDPGRREPRGSNLQHGQRLHGGVETHLAELGFEVELVAKERHLGCGSAGTYSVLQPVLAEQLRDRKLAPLEPGEPQVIASANIGCIQHLRGGTTTPVRHWVEVLADPLG